MLSGMAQEAFPPGVMNILTGGDELGQLMVEHPKIAQISFTGSVLAPLRCAFAQKRTAMRTMSARLCGGLMHVSITGGDGQEDHGHRCGHVEEGDAGARRCGKYSHHPMPRLSSTVHGCFWFLFCIFLPVHTAVPCVGVGNDPALVLPDVDAKDVANKIFGAAMFNTGQVCVAVKRVFVHESKYEEMVDAFGEAATKSKAVMNDGMKEGTRYGPINVRH